MSDCGLVLRSLKSHRCLEVAHESSTNKRCQIVYLVSFADSCIVSLIEDTETPVLYTNIAEVVLHFFRIGCSKPVNVQKKVAQEAQLLGQIIQLRQDIYQTTYGS